MKLVIQRAQSAAVSIAGETVGEIQAGLMILVGFTHEDTAEEVHKKIQKVIQLRIFNDEEGKMNLSVLQTGGSILVVSQFTLYAQTQKGNRPSFITAAPPEIAIPLYEQFVQGLKKELGEHKVSTGRFGADMQVSLINDGPVTLIME